MRKQSIARAAALFFGLYAARAGAHGVVGQRSFIEPFVTEDVNPKNEFVIARPEWTGSGASHALSYGFGLEKKLTGLLQHHARFGMGPHLRRAVPTSRAKADSTTSESP